MSEAAETLRRAYMGLQEVCTELGRLSREAREESADLSAGDEAPIERARQQAAKARMDIWKVLKETVWVDWLNETETPDLFHLSPPKDMPRSTSDT